MRAAGRLPLVSLLWIVVCGVAQGYPISDPIQLNPFLPGAFISVAEVHSLKGDLGDEETVNSLALAGFQPNSGGAYADFTNGALGLDVVGSPDGTGQVAAADLFVNVAFSGTGSNTLHMHIDGAFDTFGNPVLNGVGFSAEILCTHVNMSNHTFNGCPEASIQGGDPVPFFGNVPLAFPYDLAITFPVDATHTNYQFIFNIDGNANGAAELSVAHTALISFDLAPGVTMDQSSGFLTTPGDITLPGDHPPSSVPEPSTLAPAALGLLALAGRGAWSRKHGKSVL